MSNHTTIRIKGSLLKEFRLAIFDGYGEVPSCRFHQLLIGGKTEGFQLDAELGQALDFMKANNLVSNNHNIHKYEEQLSIELGGKIPEELIKKLDFYRKLRAANEALSRYWHIGDYDLATVDLDSLPATLIDALEAFVAKHNRNVKSVPEVLAAISNYRLLMTTVIDGEPETLPDLAVWLINRFVSDEKKFLFTVRHHVPVAVTVNRVEWLPEIQEYSRELRRKVTVQNEQVQVVVCWRERNLSKTAIICLYSTKDVVKQLAKAEYFFSTPELECQYNELMHRYEELSSKTGLQCWAEGDAEGNRSSSRWWETSSRKSFMVDGEPSRVIIDNEHTSGTTESNINEPKMAFWNKELRKRHLLESKSTEEESAQDKENQRLPLWPFLQVFSLQSHEYLIGFVNQFTEYVYDKTAFSKLIIPENQKNIISKLVQVQRESCEDIISGKQGGLFILCSGPPGCGKTLTAEVYSEYSERALYKISCTELGTDLTSIEKNLVKILTQTVRWNAILLLDEVDVYVHKRGNSLTQNAIVGVFLKVAEYFRGTCFMTTNLAETVDEAMLSRTIAHIRYEYPNSDQVAQIVDVLSTQYGMTVQPEVLDLLNLYRFEKTSPVSGRDIKGLLRLLKKLGVTEVTKQDMVDVAEFKGLTVDDNIKR